MTATAPTPQQVLALPLPDNGSGARTVAGYLRALLIEVWREKDGFSGKYPFGESDWEYDLYGSLVEAGMVQDKLDAADRKVADKLILAAIAALGTAGDGAPMTVPTEEQDAELAAYRDGFLQLAYDKPSPDSPRHTNYGHVDDEPTTHVQMTHGGLPAWLCGVCLKVTLGPDTDGLRCAGCGSPDHLSPLLHDEPIPEE